jgi:hypothetical protein
LFSPLRLPTLGGREKGGKTGETGEEFDLLNNNDNNNVLTGLTGLTGLADPNRRLIEWLVDGKRG